MDDWRKGIVFIGGSEASEGKIIEELGTLVSRQVREIQGHTGEAPRRPQHAKTLATTSNARFVVCSDLSEDLRVGFLVPDASYPATLRFSNAGALIVNDREADLRGLAAKIRVDKHVEHDFLGTNAEIHHAKNAFEAMWASYYLYKSGLVAKVLGIGRLMLKVGFQSGQRIIKTLNYQVNRPVISLATETFWSRSPYRFGQVVGRFRIGAVQAPEPLGAETDSLGVDLAKRCEGRAVEYILELQRYHDEATTPLEDSTLAWSTPFERIGTFRIEKGTSLQNFTDVEPLQFSPWNISSEEFEPLGNMNRARKLVYQASQRARAN